MNLNMKPLPQKPDTELTYAAHGTMDDGWSFTRFRGSDGKEYFKKQKLTFGTKGTPPFQCHWFECD